MIRTLILKLNARLQARTSIRELARLTDRELNDLGMSRGDIVDVVRQGALAAG